MGDHPSPYFEEHKIVFKAFNRELNIEMVTGGCDYCASATQLLGPFNNCIDKLSFTLVPSSSSFFVHVDVTSFHPLVASYPF